MYMYFSLSQFIVKSNVKTDFFTVSLGPGNKQFPKKI